MNEIDLNEIINSLSKMSTKMNLISKENLSLQDQMMLTDSNDICLNLLKELRQKLTSQVNLVNISPSSYRAEEIRKSMNDSQNQTQNETNELDDPILKKLTNKKIMIIDDDVDTHKVLSFYFTQKCLQVFAFEDPEQALKELNNIKPDYILLDLMMPQMTGFEFLRRYKLGKFHQTKILVGSSMNYDKDRLEALKLGANDFIAKPYNIEEVIYKIKEL
ncbi:MAG: response regulator transcription factor [Candidatus Margulisiibacteriota bacterium]|jgi:PleD family two-component response regulator